MDVAVVGLGYFSRFHLDAWSRQDGARLVAVADPDAGRRTWAEAGYGVAAYADTDALLAAHSPELVDIVAPPATHAALIRRLARAGVTLICQKPFCTSLDEAERTTEIAEAAGARLIVHENFRFQPWHRTIKAALDEGLIGQVYGCRFALRPGDGRGPDAYLDRQPFFRDMPQFLVRETGVHFIDLFRWLFGEVETVYADLRRLNPAIQGEDAGLLVLGHTGGVQTVFDGNRLADHDADDQRRTMGEMEVEGALGTLRLDGSGTVRFRARDTRGWTVIPPVAPVDPNAFGGGCVAALIDHVVQGLAGDCAIENEARAYLPVIRAVGAAYRSAGDGRKIAL